ncbi:MAG: hypothetical protein Q7R79_01325, partial [bacterium]|nr:hypothetical protein [bacterium]
MMNDLYFLGEEIIKIKKGLAAAVSMAEENAWRKKLKSVQDECPHWDEWKTPSGHVPGESLCRFCDLDWSDVEKKRLGNIEVMIEKGKTLHWENERTRQMIEALIASCPHPKEKIENEPKRTYCRRCKTTLWPAQFGRQGWFVTPSLEDINNLPDSLLKFEQKKQEIFSAIIVLQAGCSHPEEKKTFDQGDFDCGVCGLPWSEVCRRKEI